MQIPVEDKENREADGQGDGWTRTDRILEEEARIKEATEEPAAVGVVKENTAVVRQSVPLV